MDIANVVGRLFDCESLVSGDLTDSVGEFLRIGHRLVRLGAF